MPADQVICYRFLNEQGPYRCKLLEWSRGDCPMFGPMFRELLGYSTGLIVMQLLESRHSLLKRFLAWRHKQYPATLSAALRRRENKDLEEPDFQSNLPELLASVGELDVGEWLKNRVLGKVPLLSMIPCWTKEKTKRCSMKNLQLQQVTNRGKPIKNTTYHWSGNMSRQRLRETNAMLWRALMNLPSGPCFEFWPWIRVRTCICKGHVSCR